MCIILFALLTVFLYLPPKAACADPSLQTIFATPFSINGTKVGIGNSVTVNINITNGLNVWSWGVALKFDPAILNCTGRYEGEFLKRSGDTLWQGGAIDNTKGQVAQSAASCTAPNLPVSGSGQLMNATFKVKANGISDIHLLNVEMSTYSGGVVSTSHCQVLDKYTVIASSNAYIVSITHNATGTISPWAGIPNLILDSNVKSLKFNMTCKNTKVFCNVTIPKTLVWLQSPSDTWTVKVATVSVTFTQSEDSTNTYIYFTTTYGTSTSTKLVEIIGTAAIPEFQPITIIPLILATLAAVIIITRRKLRRDKVQWQTQTLKTQL